MKDRKSGTIIITKTCIATFSLFLMIICVCLGINKYGRRPSESDKSSQVRDENSDNVSDGFNEDLLNEVNEADTVNTDGNIYDGDDDIRVSLSVWGGLSSIRDGRLSIGMCLGGRLEQEDDGILPYREIFPVTVAFSSKAFEAFIYEKGEEIRGKYSPQWQEHEDALYGLKDEYNKGNLSPEEEREQRAIIDKKWELFNGHMKEELDDMRVRADEYYLKPAMMLFRELGINLVKKKIYVVNENGDVAYSSALLMAYVDRRTIERMEAFIADKNFGIGLESPPKWLEGDSSTVTVGWGAYDFLYPD